MFIYSPYNSTEIAPSLFSVLVIYSIYIISFLIVLSVSLVIFYLTLTNQKLKTFTNLLICNTCFISLFYSVTIFLQVFMVVFAPLHSSGIDSRPFCIVRAYLTVVSTTLLSWSFLLQALSRLLHSVFYSYRRCLLTWKFHYLLITVQWIVGFLTPITILLNHGDVIYQRSIFCTIELTHTFHLYYLYSTEYIIPVLSILLIYIIIVYRINYYSSPSKQRHSSPIREVKLLKNILILVAIFTFGGLPSVIYICLMAPQRILSINFFIITLVSVPLSVAMEKVSVLWLNTPFRNAFVRCCCCVVRKRNRNSMLMSNTKRIVISTRQISVELSKRKYKVTLAS